MSDRRVEVSQEPDGSSVVSFSGRWHMDQGIPRVEPFADALTGRVVFDTRGLEEWDTSLVVFIMRVRELCAQRRCALELSGLPEGARRLLVLAQSPPTVVAPKPALRPTFEARIGWAVKRGVDRVDEFLAFLGNCFYSIGRLLSRRARFRRVDLLSELQNASVGAAAIVAVVGILLGMILAFVAIIILRRFGASIYVADVVTIGMVRELGPLMTSIIMAGRTGSSYAAQLGTMRVTDEIEALTTMGLSAQDFLVLPRLLALSLMTPLLALFADAVGLVAGAAVSMTLTDIDFAQYLVETRLAIPMSTFWIGMIKSAVFGVLIAVIGCAEGMRAGKSAASVGHAATSAVVQSVILIIAADGISAVILYFVGL